MKLVIWKRTTLDPYHRQLPGGGGLQKKLWFHNQKVPALDQGMVYDQPYLEMLE